ncbi:hypothetical protein SDC9_66673 [bioreactor metagenome]|uniref:Secretion system C-terminal sorting domain-containing protein n=1 Tax=bioreactor metagenome TaxID=1076179 RepID=A0A644Y276_9ZZZZ
MDASGKMLSAKSLSTLQGSPEMREIDLSEYAPGVYYLQVISNSDVKLFKILRE